METETITRPNGKAYRPRKAPRVELYVDTDELTCVVVLGTHDPDIAAPLATSHWLEWNDGEPLPTGRREWLRLVPFDTGSGYERNWIKDDRRGTACVVFDHD